MTRFVGESLQTRTGRNSKALLGKDRQKSMKVFQETGKHPLIEATREENARDVLTPLPTLDINRPHIFMDFQHQGKPQGRVIVELFEDLYPTVCAAFRHRCLEVCFARCQLVPHRCSGASVQRTAQCLQRTCAGKAVLRHLHHIMCCFALNAAV